MLFFIGLALFLDGLALFFLGGGGLRAQAEITGVRQELKGLSDWANIESRKHLYSISYRFMLPEGGVETGKAFRITTEISAQAEGLRTVWVRFFPPYTRINALESDTGSNTWPLACMGIGAVLLLLCRRRARRKRE